MTDRPAASTVPALAARIPFARRAYRFARSCLALIGLLTVIYTGCFDLSQITSPSMKPTLMGTSEADGDWVLSEKITYRVRNPHRWELVDFKSPEGFEVMKRAVGLPGESISLDDFRISINGGAVPVPPSLSFLRYYGFGPYIRNGKAAACGDGYFVFGDDSKDSQDSRFEGPLAPGRIRSRPWLIVWPLSRFGLVNP